MEVGQTTGSTQVAPVPQNLETSQTQEQSSKSSLDGKSIAPAPKKKAAKPAQTDAKEEVKPQPKPGFRLTKVDGTEYEVPEEEYHRAAQKALGAEKRLWEAAQREKLALQKLAEAEELKKKYGDFETKSPATLFQEVQAKLKDPNTTKEFRVAAEKWLTEQILADEQSPEMKRLTAAERELNEYKEKEKREAEARAKKEEEDKRNAALENYRKTAQERIINVLKVADLPPNEFMVKQIVDQLKAVSKLSPDIRPTDEQLANIIKTDTIGMVNHFVGGIADNIIKARESGDQDAILKAGEALISHVPESLLKAVRIYDLVKHTTTRGGMQQKPLVDVAKAESTPKNGAYELSWAEYQENKQKMIEDAQKAWKRPQ